MQATILLYAIIFLYGIIIGSFLNVCICRIPRKESVVRTRSHCMECGASLKWCDLIPFFSWLLLKGRCRNCKAKISMQYPLIELINGIAYVWITARYGVTVTAVLYSLCVSALLALSVIDWRTYEIPPVFPAFIAILGSVRVITDLTHWGTYVVGLFSVSGFLFIIWLVTRGRGMGGGDIKLMAAAGLLIGWKLAFLSLAWGCMLGTVIHICLRGKGKKERVLAFGPYLSGGIFLAMLYGEQFLEWYWHTML